jgi:hypothetical protein
MSMCYAHLKSGDFRRQGLARGVPLEPPNSSIYPYYVKYKDVTWLQVTKYYPVTVVANAIEIMRSERYEH